MRRVSTAHQGYERRTDIAERVAVDRTSTVFLTDVVLVESGTVEVDVV